MIAVYCILSGTTYNITNLCQSVTISGEIKGVCRQLEVKMAYGVYTKNFPAQYVPAYMPIWVRDENSDGSLKSGLISAKVIDASRTHDTYTITAFDFAYYLKRSTITKNFNNITAEDGTKEVLKELGVAPKYIFPSKILINKFVTQKNAYDTIMGLYTDVYKQTGIKFFLMASYMNEVGVYRVNWETAPTLIQPCSDVNTPNGNLISIEFKENGENMVTRVKCYDKDNQLIDTIDSEEYKQYPDYYGILQENYVQEDDKDYKTVVNTIIHGIDKEITVEVLGDYEYYSGRGTKIYVPWIDDLNTTNGKYATAYITSDSHTWDLTNGNYITKLELSLNEVMDEKELEDANKDSDDMESRDEYSSSEATGASVVKYAKKFLGLKYVWGGTSLTTGADCSGFTQAVYAHFGVTIGRTTYDQMKNGKAISTTDKSKWKKGDLIFPHSGHVVMYVGDGQVIHSPKTGDVVKISNVYFGTPVAVRRVI